MSPRACLAFRGCRLHRCNHGLKIVLPAHVARCINCVVNKFAVPDVPINNALVADGGMTVKMIYAG